MSSGSLVIRRGHLICTFRTAASLHFSSNSNTACCAWRKTDAHPPGTDAAITFLISEQTRLSVHEKCRQHTQVSPDTIDISSIESVLSRAASAMLKLTRCSRAFQSSPSRCNRPRSFVDLEADKATLVLQLLRLGALPPIERRSPRTILPRSICANGLSRLPTGADSFLRRRTSSELPAPHTSLNESNAFPCRFLSVCKNVSRNAVLLVCHFDPRPPFPLKT
jgi:hypothetical protein